MTLGNGSIILVGVACSFTTLVVYGCQVHYFIYTGPSQSIPLPKHLIMSILYASIHFN